MPELGRIRVIAMSLEDPAFLTTVHRHEPGSVLELGSSIRHRQDLSAIAAIPMNELDRAQHVHLANNGVRKGPTGGVSGKPTGGEGAVQRRRRS